MDSLSYTKRYTTPFLNMKRITHVMMTNVMMMMMMMMTFYKMMKEIMMMMMVCDLLFLHLFNEDDLNVCRMINKMIT